MKTQSVTVVTICTDHIETVRLEYEGKLIGESHAIYADPSYNFLVLERVRNDNGVYVTTGGGSSIVFDLQLPDLTFFENIDNMSAVEFLQNLLPQKQSKG